MTKESDVSGRKIKPEPEWKPVSLCGVVGVFEQPDIGKVAFAGYIKIIEEDGSLVGELIDVYGPSRIEGFLKGDKLEFRKNYTLREKRPDKTLVNRLEKTQGNHFKGEISVTGRPEIKLKTELWIFQIEKDAYHITAGPPEPEEMVKRFYKKG